MIFLILKLCAAAIFALTVIWIIYEIIADWLNAEKWTEEDELKHRMGYNVNR